jgi:glutamyl-tRNA synthetase
LRGDDLLSSTARQLALYQALGLAPPRHAHVPLLYGPDGARLSKRHGSIAVADFRQRGVAPAQLVGLLAASLGLAAPDELLRPHELVARFRPSAIVNTALTSDQLGARLSPGGPGRSVTSP